MHFNSKENTRQGYDELYAASVVFSARQHAIARYTLSLVCLSVRPSVRHTGGSVVEVRNLGSCNCHHRAGMDTGRVDPRVGSGRVGSGRNFLNALFLSVSRVK